MDCDDNVETDSDRIVTGWGFGGECPTKFDAICSAKLRRARFLAELVSLGMVPFERVFMAAKFLFTIVSVRLKEKSKLQIGMRVSLWSNYWQFDEICNKNLLTVNAAPATFYLAAKMAEHTISMCDEIHKFVVARGTGKNSSQNLGNLILFDLL